MRSYIVNALNEDNDYWMFLRENPHWHRILSRHPEQIKNFFSEYKVLRRKRLIDRIEDTANILQLMQECFLKLSVVCPKELLILR